MLTSLQQPHGHLPLGAGRQEKSLEGITFDLGAIWKPHSDLLISWSKAGEQGLPAGDGCKKQLWSYICVDVGI